MQIDMHFYGVYALARAAGINPETARIIAHASQFVDDAIEDDLLILDDKAILPTMTSHRPLDYKNALPLEQWNVWVPFHFLPGNEPPSGSFAQRMICRKDSDPARRMLRYALDPTNETHWPCLIGIAAHVYADTFSHFGFIGLSHPWNRVKADSIEVADAHSPSLLDYIRRKFEDFKTRFEGDFAELIPVGHGAVATYPDRPYLKWRFEYEQGIHDEKDMVRDNTMNFLDGCEGLYEFFKEFVRVNPDCRKDEEKPWESIAPHIEKILGLEAPKEERVRAWKDAIRSGVFSDVTPIDIEISYDKDSWLLKRHIGDPQITRTHAYRFWYCQPFCVKFF